MIIIDAVHNPRAQLSRVALLYVLLVLLTSIGLLSRYLPLWISGVGAGCLLWRLQVFRGRWSFPATWLKALLVLGCTAGVVLSNRKGISLDAFVALLLTGLSLKSLEVYHRKNAQLFLYVSVLVLMSFLLYAQAFIASVLASLQLLLIVAALVAINSDHQQLSHGFFQPVKRALVTLAFAVPLLVFLFVVMPRVSPLWTMPLQKQQARTGMGDEMRPGDFNELTRSSDLVMRVTFNTAMLPKSELYWRAILLDSFDGRVWRNECDCNYQWRLTSRLEQPAIQPAYRVILQPHGNKWLFALAKSTPFDKSIWGNDEGIFRHARDVRDRLLYDVWALADPQPPFVLSAADRERNTRLPGTGNAQARGLAAQWRSAGKNDVGIIAEAISLYRQAFTYTLQPPALGVDSVDEFLFTTRKGFCEHFAGAFVFLMRAAGIPARVVMGYQGGEVVTDERYVNVRQYDAHAWAEVWLPEQGWVMVDPTSAVAPERIENGFAALFPESEALTNALGLSPYRSGSVLNFFRMKLDYLDYVVGRWVLGYDANVQQSLFKQWGLQSPWRLLAWFLGTLLGFFALFLLYLQWRERHARREHPVTAAYRRLCHAYARQNLLRQTAETPLQFALRVQQGNLPEHQRFMAISTAYHRWNYLADETLDEAALLQQMRRCYWRLRLHYRR